MKKKMRGYCILINFTQSLYMRLHAIHYRSVNENKLEFHHKVAMNDVLMREDQLDVRSLHDVRLQCKLTCPYIHSIPLIKLTNMLRP